MPDIDPHFEWIRDDLQQMEARVTKQMLDGHHDIKTALSDSEARTNTRINKVEKRLDTHDRWRVVTAVAISVLSLSVLGQHAVLQLISSL